MGDFSNRFLEKLNREYALKETDLKDGAVLKKSGMTFKLRSFEIVDIGHFFMMDMSGMMGLMKLETMVLAADTKNVPLLNLNYLDSMGKEELMAEYYNLLDDELPAELEERFMQIKAGDADLENSPVSDNWYNQYLMPISYHKTGRKLKARYLVTAEQQMNAFMDWLRLAGDADRQLRNEKTLAFAEALLADGGSAINTFIKLFGKEKAREIVMEYMYGVK